MTAATLHAPGWAPIGARDLKQHSRRYVRFGLALSGALHLLLLAGILWIQARIPSVEPRWNLKPVVVDPAPTIPPVDLPNAPPEDAYPAPRTGDGGLVPVDEPVDVGDLPGAQPIQVKSEPGDGWSGRPAVLERPPYVTGDEPGETAFVAYDVAPVPTYRPDPVYPDWAREAGIEGRVVLHVLVGQDGRVKRVTVRRNILGLGEAAQEAIVHWVFRPARFNRQPVSVWVEIPVQFKLGQ
jgi:protein TonB